MKALRYELATVFGLVFALSSMGCRTLNESTTVPGGVFDVDTSSEVIESAKSTGASLMEKVASVLPKRERSTMMAPNLVPKDDPTSLEYEPGEISPELYLAAARLSENNGRFDVAVKQYGKALSQDPNHRNGLIGLARLQHRLGNVPASIRLYSQALAANPGDSVIMNDLGLCYSRLGRMNDAIAAFEDAARANPRRPIYVNNLAAALVDAEREADAIEYLSRKRGPAKAHFQVGYLLEQAGRADQATSHLQLALDLDPNLHQARSLLDRQLR